MLARVGADPFPLDHEIGRFMEREGATWANVTKAANIKMQ
jgi:hypothetical protein